MPSPLLSFEASMMTMAQPRPDPVQSLVLRTPRLTLRPLRTSDADRLVAGLGDAAVSRMLANIPHPYRHSDAAAFLALAASQHEARSDLHLAILREEEFVGGISLHGLPDVADFGYWIGRDHWGCGYASEAAAGVLAHAFGALRAERVPSGVFVGNPASLRVQDKLGFERTGMSRRFSLARGTLVDHIDTVIRREQFDERNP